MKSIHRPPATAVFILLAGMATAALAGDPDKWNGIPIGDDVVIGAKGLLQYDVNVFTNDALPDGTGIFKDAHTWRREQLKLYLRKGNGFSIDLGYDFHSRQWLDNYLALQTKFGRFRAGQFKTPVGWEDGNTSSSATTFLERSLPEQAVYQGRRMGLEWRYAPEESWLMQVAGFARHDLNDDAAGRTFAGRVVFAPKGSSHDVLHLGLSVSRELRDDRTARVRARPEVSLTPVRLVDTGTLQGVDRIDRSGLEAAWQHGPVLVQGEYLCLAARRPAAPDYKAHGYYVSGSWVLTGETRMYKHGAFGGVASQRDWGALELALRYATLDLDDGTVTGGREHDWTLGLNWYLGAHFKLQMNYIRAFSDRGNLHVDPRIYAMRAQVSF